jgi:hypothetical protein
MAINLQILKEELVNDPLSLGYSQKLLIRDDMGLCELINRISEGEEFKVSRGRISKDTFLENTTTIVFGLIQKDYDGDTNAKFWLDVFDRLVANADTINCDDLFLQSLLDQMIGSNLITESQKENVLYRQGSRAEKLFGCYVTLDSVSNSLNEVNE